MLVRGRPGLLRLHQRRQRKNGDVNADGFQEDYGQVWRFLPDRAELELIFESPGAEVLDSPDNLTVTPRGGLIFCEDDAGSGDGDTHPLAPGLTDVNRLVGLTASGEAFEFAVNRLNDGKLAGACFSPSGRTLFANLFGDGTAGCGMSVAITGPWRAGPCDEMPEVGLRRRRRAPPSISKCSIS
jgi:uncharacterized protein